MINHKSTESQQSYSRTMSGIWKEQNSFTQFSADFYILGNELAFAPAWIQLKRDLESNDARVTVIGADARDFCLRIFVN